MNSDRVLREGMFSEKSLQPYFAYGMNMNHAHMREIVPGAQIVSQAILEGYRFGIASHGYATVTPALGESVPGVVFLLSKEEVGVLDEFEGVHCGMYEKQLLHVRLPNTDDVVECLTYVTTGTASGKPQPGYLDVVIEGAIENQLPAKHLKFLRTLAAQE
ncbi:MAG: gamma-glutamylcyclotransferase family protein [Verrucomicrobiota bacterium]